MLSSLIPGGEKNVELEPICNHFVFVLFKISNLHSYSVRAIQNSAMTENLVLIRVADAGSEYDEEGYDAVSPTNFIDFSGFFFKRLKSVEKFFCKIQTGT